MGLGQGAGEFLPRPPELGRAPPAARVEILGGCDGHKTRHVPISGMRHVPILGGALRLAGCVLLVACAGSRAAERDVSGCWVPEARDSVLLIEVLPATVRGSVAALQYPRFRPGEGIGTPGATRTDVANPDPALRDRPMLGLEILHGFAWDGDAWRGRVYDPISGNTYACRLDVDHGRLEIHGYIGLPLFGRSAYLEALADVRAELAWQVPPEVLERCP